MKKLHFVGIGGSGIAGVADLAEKFGYEITGCDLEASTAYGRNIVQGHNPSHLNGIDLVITSPALFYQEQENTEIAEAKKLGKLMTWQEFLGTILLKDKKLICIAGTHGKSTTTAMAGKMLIDNGLDPVVVVGAVVPEWGGNSRFGKGEYAVIEADEFNNNFLFYKPEIAIINNIEFDHPDFFKNEEEVKESFKKFTNNLIGRKLLITEKDSLGKKFNLKVFGNHNQKNANMVYVLGKKLGISDEEISKSIESFGGIGRRMELIADRGGIKVYDDYAHHPTAIAATLEGVREKYPKAKILVVDEPHGYKRTKALLSNYKGVFDNVDSVIIGPIFQARDEVDNSITPGIVAKASNHQDISFFNSSKELIENCKLKIVNYDVVVVMGAGKSYLWAREIAGLIPIKFSDITTFKIGGRIGNYVELKNEDEVHLAVREAKNKKHKIFIVGDGTDILASDSDFDDFVLKYTADNISFEDDGTVIGEGGANWDKLVELSVEKGLQGIEALSGIPGTVGAAPIQNIGAYGSELKDVLISLDAYDIENEKIKVFKKDDCEFGYRESIFKRESYWQKYIILKVKLKLTKRNTGSVNYESLSKYISAKNPTIRQIREAVLRVRAEKLENPKLIANAGSFFKNPIISSEGKTRLLNEFPDMTIFPFGEKFKISAAWLIEKCGWKGKTFKGAAVSSKHALILTNPKGRATAKEVFDLSEKIITDVFVKFGIKLEREVQLINF